MLGIAFGLAICALLLWFLHGTYYRFGERDLWIHCGPFRFRIAYDEVDATRPTRNPLSAPALSLDRLEITYAGGQRKIRISPEDKVEFETELKSRCGRL